MGRAGAKYAFLFLRPYKKGTTERAGAKDAPLLGAGALVYYKKDTTGRARAKYAYLLGTLVYYNIVTTGRAGAKYALLSGALKYYKIYPSSRGLSISQYTTKRELYGAI